jgi:DNA primase
LTDEQLNLMKRYGKEVRLFFDMDGAGQKAARKSAELALSKELQVTIVGLPLGKDAAEIGKESAEQLRDGVEKAVPALRYFLSAEVEKNDISTAVGKRQVVDGYVKLLKVVKNPIERSEAIKDLARAIDMDERLITGMVSKLFLDQVRRDGPPTLMPPADPFREQHTFGKRSELLREEVIAIMYAESALCHSLLSHIAMGELKGFFDAHPLFFFLVQSGGKRDPLSLIEDQALKSEATRLSFRIMESPEITGKEGEERLATLSQMAERYLADLHIEVTQREKLIFLEKALDEARAKKDKVLERELLAQFVVVSGKGSVQGSSPEKPARSATDSTVAGGLSSSE